MLVAAVITITLIGVALLCLLVWAIHAIEDSLPKAPGALVLIAVLALMAACISGGYATHFAYHRPNAVVCPVTAEAP